METADERIQKELDGSSLQPCYDDEVMENNMTDTQTNPGKPHSDRCHPDRQCSTCVTDNLR
ncbi:hypothetical protein JOB18_039940 [Solea senegalensis]|uniref:Uncharacterized protein n=1 Tax=Solea senegalensis TaxID=28829 RepID=A0AAV6T167_SOLSE|nr:hypothetical protein JOB18_039940 [Solea senegalensis]